LPDGATERHLPLALPESRRYKRSPYINCLENFLSKTTSHKGHTDMFLSRPLQYLQPVSHTKSPWSAFALLQIISRKFLTTETAYSGLSSCFLMANPSISTKANDMSSVSEQSMGNAVSNSTCTRRLSPPLERRQTQCPLSSDAS